jgi:hypothetical protein
MVATNDDITFWMSGGVTNGDPTLSIGGAISTTIIGQINSGILGNIWPFVTSTQAAAGIIEEYRCMYVKNVNPTDSIKQMRLFFENKNSDQDVSISMGLDPAGKNGTPATIANEFTAPAGVVFSQPLNYSNGLKLGKIQATEFYPFWVKRSVAPGAIPYYADAYVVRAEGFPITQALTDWGFSCAGRLGCKSSAVKTNINNMTNRLKATPPLKLFLTAGDMAHDKTAKCWFSLDKKIDKQVKITFSESDQKNVTELKNHYGLANQYYSFDIQNVHFLVMASSIAYDTNSTQYSFVKTDLDTAFNRADIDWIMVSHSQPYYTAGGNADTAPFVAATWRDIYHPMFDTYMVDLVIQSREQNYQRTKPLTYNSGSPSTPTVTDVGTTTYLDPTGRIYLIVGTGGHGLEPTTSSPTYLAFSESTYYGYLWLSFSQIDATLTGTFFNTSNTIADTFSITRTDIQN